MVKHTFVFEKNATPFNIPELVQAACQYQSRIMLSNDHSSFNAKSIMGMMALDPTDGPLVVSAEGPDEADALRAIVKIMSP